MIYFDLDGVLADYDSFVRSLIYPSYSRAEAQAEVSDSTRAAVKEQHLAYGLSFFDSFPPIEAGFTALRLAKDYWGSNNIRILTATGHFNTALVIKQKLAFCLDHGIPSSHVITVGNGIDKAFYAQPYDVLIDDSEKNIEAWIESGGIGLLFTEDDFLYKLCTVLQDL